MSDTTADDMPRTEAPLSAVLSQILEMDGQTLTIEELTHRFGDRAIGAMLFVFGLACLLPLPPGATTIFGAPLVLLAPQLIVRGSSPWLPRAIRERTIAMEDLRKGLPGAIRWLRRIEAVSKPRLGFVFGPVGERLIGVVCLGLALVLILPIPGGNFLPALAVSALSFALIQRDGAIALVGYGLAITSVSVLVAAAHIIVKMFLHIWSVVTSA